MKTEIEYKGHTITLEWEQDCDMGEPWKEHDGHGIVGDQKRHPFGRGTKPPTKAGEKVLYWQDGYYRTYDIAETIKLATKDGWGLHPDDIAKLGVKLGHKPTRKEIVAESVERDFEYIRRWCNDDWWWCGYVVKIEGTNYHESLWGIDSDSQKEFEDEAISEAKAWLDRELIETADAACRDIVAA